MKKSVIIICLACLALILVSNICAVPEDVSWQLYCEKYEIDSDDPTPEEINFYLDCYAGSVEEEQDLIYFNSWK